jgi:phosphoglycolate phosphatase-like HAD superfamily hydrolase
MAGHHHLDEAMATFDDSCLEDEPGNIEVVRPVGRRRITHIVHDIDGTHSLIRDWPPVMSLVIRWAMTCGLEDDFDSPDRAAALVERVGKEPLPETDEFCIETAGLSAITQMEYGIRRAVELGNVPAGAGLALTDEQRNANSEIIRSIWHGEERFDHVEEPPELRAFVQQRAPRLFKLYERVLNKASRDRNTAAARAAPAKWRVPGSMEFIRHLHAAGCLNYFVTGAVIYEDGGMCEEVHALGFETGPGKIIESLEGSSWDRKMPKDEVMRELCRREGLEPSRVLVIGDGRSEIKAGAEMGCVTMSRLPAEAARLRKLHKLLGTNYILPDFTSPVLKRLIRRE